MRCVVVRGTTSGSPSFTVNEVIQALESAVTEGGDAGGARQLRVEVERRAQGLPPAAEAPPAKGAALDPMDLRAPMKEAQRKFETRYVKDLLHQTSGNVAAAARLAGITRPNFHRKCRALGIDPGRFKSRPPPRGPGTGPPG
jgi:DNA-binding NtrC family response regulator